MTAANLAFRSGAAGIQPFTGMEPAHLSRLGVWRGDDWQPGGGAATQVQASGHAGLDLQLPGGGWPVGAMSEILLPQHAHPEWSLVASALAAVLKKEQSAQHAVLVAPPLQVFTPALQMSGVAAAQLCCVHPESSALAFSSRRRAAGATSDAASIWVSEQALRCRDVGAVLAWLPQSQPPALRRLQLLAAQQRKLLWVFRPEPVRAQASPAPLRLWIEALESCLRVHVIKRRGPPLQQPVDLPLLHGQLLAELSAQKRRKAQMHLDAQAQLAARPHSSPSSSPSSSPGPSDLQEARHALAGLAFATHR